MTTFIEHKKARLNYEILDTIEAGIELAGFEVKAVRSKLGSLDGAHVTVRGGEAYLIGSFIPPYQPTNSPKDYDPKQNRRLLINKKQRLTLERAEHEAGLTIVPLAMYNSGRWIKVSIAIVRGKKKFDKREDLKKRQTDRDIRRELADR